jgi:predicted RNase H-like nuclease
VTLRSRLYLDTAGPTLLRVYFAGVDLAWAGRNPTGVAVLDTAGRLVHSGAVRDDAAIIAALRPYVQGDCLVAFDAPLVVTNPTGQRPAEAALNRDFHRFEAGAHPANTAKPEFADVPRGARLARALDLDMDPRSSAGRRAIEVYPHPATVVLFRLARTLKYKARPGRDLDQRRAELLLLMDGVEQLAHAPVPLRVASHDDWARLRRQVVAAQRKSDLRHAEDPVDAVVCAYVALYAQRRPADVTIYGDFSTGYIVTPSLPAELA